MLAVIGYVKVPTVRWFFLYVWVLVSFIAAYVAPNV